MLLKIILYYKTSFKQLPAEKIDNKIMMTKFKTINLIKFQLNLEFQQCRKKYILVLNVDPFNYIYLLKV